ncbi:MULTISPECIES: M16 family metallopeptidase [Chryseobacterium]|uniref:Zn-dependent peptidase n=1 Tax=Chryseobacterium rhizosphaerae TaxID=395937 RepID=A0AAE3Y9D3_9FLAO|nr:MULTISPECIES: M16 family metallopeptidase [Chryseobacterium]MBL3549362.1 insulinase family protein [Chryseobacterium sp. KMC2]MDR6526312.1 putative Zn-dependent peptidase [Chryseobacterium rhizosphaerae]SMC94009.1 Predicted Zn-dependent peptidase [Chryseobacterium sp. YR221]
MKKFFISVSLFCMLSAMAQKFETQKLTDAQGYTYETVKNDQAGVRVYTLKNGLKVYLAKNEDAPRIQTYIPVRTGSNNDPSDNTGLAHYLEHMVFKGTSNLGTQDWVKEKALLQQISDLYEQHKAEKDPAKKKELYKKIDEVSQEASKYAIANEYDKAISSLGATGTNAHTWLDETVYKNNIPSNELEKWLRVEKERFSELVLRLFHTELEAVYEEYNRAQDNDGRLVNYALMEALFPKHPNGQQTTIGTSEHLKSPSMVAIHKYFDTYYVPNNMAVVLVGDIDFDKTIKLVDQYFGAFKYKDLPMKKMVTEEPMTKVVSRTVKSPSTQRMTMAWRTDSYGSQEARLADVVAEILSNNGDAGLIDLNINQKQKTLGAGAYESPFKMYGLFALSVTPKEGQSFDEAKKLLLDQLDLVKKGQFPDWIFKAIVNDKKVQRMKGWETADGLATELYGSYIKGRTWEQELDEINEYEKITKADVVKFANEFFKDNYVVVYKEKGVNDKLVRVENPGITPIKLNREVQSPFLKGILNTKVAEIKPEFIDYKAAIQTSQVKDKTVSFVKNKYNEIAQVSYVFPFGTDNDKELSIAGTVFGYLGTDKYTPEQLKEEFYKLGISNSIRTSNDQMIVTLTGLESNMKKGVELMNHWMTNVKADKAIYSQTVKTILEARAVGKKDKGRIMAALSNYAKYGKDSRMTDIVSKDRLEGIDVTELMKKIKTLNQYPYQIFLYGQDQTGLEKAVKPYVVNTSLQPAKAKEYTEPATTGKVYFTNYDMVQMEMAKVAKGSTVNLSNFGKSNVFNEYFGRGLSSIVFQEIRESKSLAYSAYVSYGNASEKGHANYITNYIGTQSNKLPLAVSAMNDLMAELPQIPAQFDNARGSALKQIASNRVNRTNIFFSQLALKKLGIDYDIRKDTYAEIQGLTLPQLTGFYNTEVKPVQYNTAIIGKKENLNMESINKMGEFQEVSLEEIFGY